MSNTEALRAAAQQALVALVHHTEQTRPIQRTADAIAALRAALAQPAASGEPGATHMQMMDHLESLKTDPATLARLRAAATAHPAPARVPLTEAQIKTMKEAAADQGLTGIAPSLHLARAVEAWHGITAPGAPDAGPVQ